MSTYYTYLYPTSTFSLSDFDNTYSIYNGDDAAFTINFTGGKRFHFYNSDYATIYINSNGFINFTGQDATYSPSTTSAAAKRMICMAYTDLTSNSPNSIRYKELTDTFVMLHNTIYISTSSYITFKLTLYLTNHPTRSGDISIMYGTVQDMTRATGIGFSFGTGNTADLDTTANLNNLNTYNYPRSLFLLLNNNQSQLANKELVFSPSNFVCFFKDTKILVLTERDTVEYMPIQNLKEGMQVKTYKHGFIKIHTIKEKLVYNPAIHHRIRHQLYKCKKEKYPELNEDLIITGCHGILVDTITEEHRTQINEVLGTVYITDDKYRLPACVDERTEIFDQRGDFMIYHLALEHADILMNYGIYANGLLVETTSIRYITYLANMNKVSI